MDRSMARRTKTLPPLRALILYCNESKTPFSQEFVKNLDKISALKVQKDVTGLDDAQQRMNRSELDSIIELPPSFGSVNAKHFPSGAAKVLYSENNATAGQTGHQVHRHYRRFVGQEGLARHSTTAQQ